MGAPRVDPEVRFWAKVQATEGCWWWTAAVDKDGYGRFAPTHSTRIPAHRWAYESLVGPIPAGLEPDHLCGHASCVNPLHIEPVTRRVNILRSNGLGARNARKTRCMNDHPFDVVDPRTGQRGCSICRRAAVDRYQARKAA